MLMIAEGTLHQPVTDQEHRMATAWLVPMLDAGFLHSGGTAWHPSPSPE